MRRRFESAIGFDARGITFDSAPRFLYGIYIGCLYCPDCASVRIQLTGRSIDSLLTSIPTM